LRPFGSFYGKFLYFWSFGIFFPFWYAAPRKIWQPWAGRGRKEEGVWGVRESCYLLSVIFRWLFIYLHRQPVSASDVHNMSNDILAFLAGKKISASLLCFSAKIYFVSVFSRKFFCWPSQDAFLGK
jgi:hypothetical protein